MRWADRFWDAIHQKGWLFGVVFVFPWLLGLFQLGELLGHLAVVVSVLLRKHWGW